MFFFLIKKTKYKNKENKLKCDVDIDDKQLVFARFLYNILSNETTKITLFFYILQLRIQ